MLLADTLHISQQLTLAACDSVIGGWLWTTIKFSRIGWLSF
ncbi:uncharacterized protein METZ01_LOCUS223004, partial [marine metagenome]